MNLAPEFKSRILISRQKIDIFSIYRPTRAISVHENDQHVQSWNPTTIFWKTKCSIAWQTWTLHQGSNIAHISYFISETSLVYIYHLEIYHFMKIISMFRVGISPPILRKFAKIQNEIKYISYFFRRSEKRMKIDLDKCWYFIDPYLHKDIRVFSPKIVSSPEK